MMTTKAFLLACTTLTAAAITQTAANAQEAHAPMHAASRAPTGNLVIAQAPPPIKPEDAKKKAEEEKKKGPPPGARPAPPPHPPAAPHVAPPHPAVQAKPPAPPPPHPAVQAKPPAPPSVRPAVQAKPPAPPPPAAVQKPAPPTAPATNRAGAPIPPAAQKTPDQPPQRNRAGAPPPPPAVQAKPAAPAAPPPAVQAKPAAPAAPPPAVQAKPAAAAPAPAAAVVTPPPPTKPQSANQFIQRKGEAPKAGMADVRKERHETKDGNRTVIREGDRTIVREGNRTIISHNEANRFAIGAKNVKVDRKGNDTVSVVLRPNGISIVSTADRNGHLLRRVRRDRNGHEVVIIDNGFAGAQRGNFFIDLAPPRISRERYRERYVLDAGRSNRDRIYQVLFAPPIERLEHRYTLDQVLYNYPLREYMPRVDLDVNFPTGSWQLSPDQIGQLGVIADGINRAVDKNPKEVFLIEGHTDKVGSADDNLSLSDRRAEAVAVVLTEQFGVPPENLVTQGYGEEYPKVDTDGPSRENRRVAVRRITPLIDRVAER